MDICLPQNNNYFMRDFHLYSVLLLFEIGALLLVLLVLRLMYVMPQEYFDFISRLLIKLPTPVWHGVGSFINKQEIKSK